MLALLISGLLTGLVPSHPSDENLRILFLGNSHTDSFNVPKQVKSLLESDGSGRKVFTEQRLTGFLNDLDTDEMHDKLKTGKWDIVVMQAAKVSSSHKYKYSQEGGINLAKAARANGSRVLLFVEWPRRGWDESELQYAVYAGIAKAAKVEPVPVCFAWDAMLKKNPKLDLWNADGNHTNATGAYLASCVFYYAITGEKAGKPLWRPREIDQALVPTLHNVAKQTAQSGAKRAKTLK